MRIKIKSIIFLLVLFMCCGCYKDVPIDKLGTSYIGFKNDITYILQITNINQINNHEYSFDYKLSNVSRTYQLPGQGHIDAYKKLIDLQIIKFSSDTKDENYPDYKYYSQDNRMILEVQDLENPYCIKKLKEIDKTDPESLALLTLNDNINMINERIDKITEFETKMQEVFKSDIRSAKTTVIEGKNYNSILTNTQLEGQKFINVSVNNSQPYVNVLDQIHKNLGLITKIFIEDNNKIKGLQSALLKNKEIYESKYEKLDKEMQDLKSTIERREQTIKEFDMTIENLKKVIVDQGVEIKKKDGEIKKLEETIKELTTRYYRFGTRKELINDDTLKPCGFFWDEGIDFKNIDSLKFNECNIETTIIPFDGVLEQIFPSPPEKSYTRSNNQIIIKNPIEFWISKYLVIIIKE